MEAKPIEPITLEDSSKRRYAFRPQSDMTALESAMLTQLFVKMTLNRSGDALDWPGYVEDHRLWRHFTDPLAVVAAGLDAPPKRIVIEPASGNSDVNPMMKTNRMTILDGMEVPAGWVIVSDEQLLSEAGAGGVK